MCFCAGTLAGLGLSWINKYDNKPASRWQQVHVLINDLLNHSYQMIRSKWLIQSKTKQVRPSERTVESLAHCCIKLIAHLCLRPRAHVLIYRKVHLCNEYKNVKTHTWVFFCFIAGIIRAF